MMLERFRGTLVAAAIAAGLALPAFAQIPGTPRENVFPKSTYSPYTGRIYPTRPYFSDTHLHTSLAGGGRAVHEWPFR